MPKQGHRCPNNAVRRARRGGRVRWVDMAGLGRVSGRFDPWLFRVWFCDGFSSGCRAICITDLGALDFGGDGFIRTFALIARREQEGGARRSICLISAMLLVLPLALWVLSRSEPILFRYLVSGLTLALLALLLSGLRLPANLPKPLLYMVGAISGATGGLAGLPGPPVIFYFMASPYAADRVRANTLIYLFSFDVLMLMVMILGAYLQFVPILIGLMLAAPIALGNLAGAKIFNPEYEKLYRIIAFCLIAFSAIHSMPVWE